MMKLLTRLLKLALCGVVALSFALGATAPVNAQSAGSLGDMLDLSSRLYEEGVARQDAVLVFAAARIRLRHVAIEPDAATPGWVSGRAMLRAAENLAVSDQPLREMIARQSEEIPRGGLEGPQVVSVRIAGLGEARLTHRFKRGLPAYVYAEGAPRSQLSIAVLDRRTPICQTRAEVGRAMCRWVAAREGPVITVVRNLSADAVTVLVVTN